MYKLNILKDLIKELQRSEIYPQFFWNKSMAPVTLEQFAKIAAEDESVFSKSMAKILQAHFLKDTSLSSARLSDVSVLVPPTDTIPYPHTKLHEILIQQHSANAKPVHQRDLFNITNVVTVENRNEENQDIFWGVSTFHPGKFGEASSYVIAPYPQRTTSRTLYNLWWKVTHEVGEGLQSQFSEAARAEDAEVFNTVATQHGVDKALVEAAWKKHEADVVNFYHERERESLSAKTPGTKLTDQERLKLRSETEKQFDLQLRYSPIWNGERVIQRSDGTYPVNVARILSMNRFILSMNRFIGRAAPAAVSASG